MRRPYRRAAGSHQCPEFAESYTEHGELAALGEKASVRTLMISHVIGQIDQPGMRERGLREMSAIYKGSLIFGEDRMEIPAKSPAAAKLL